MERWVASNSLYISENGNEVSQQTLWHGENCECVADIDLRSYYEQDHHHIEIEVDVDAVDRIFLKRKSGGYITYLKNGEDITDQENIREWLRKELRERIDRKREAECT